MVQLAYGLLVATNLLNAPAGFHVTSTNPVVTGQDLIEVYEGVNERLAAVHASRGAAFTTNSMTNAVYFSGLFSDLYPTYTNEVTGGPWVQWNYGAWAHPVEAWFPAFPSETFYPFLFGHVKSALVFSAAWAQLPPLYLGSAFVRSYTTTGATHWTSWTRASLYTAAGLYSNVWTAVSDNNIPPPNAMTISNLTCLYSAVSNLADTVMQASPAWQYNARSEIIQGGAIYRPDGTSYWYVAEMATGTTCYLDISCVSTETLDTTTFPFVKRAETNVFDVITSPTNHYGPSTNLITAGAMGVPFAGSNIYYRVEFPRQPVIRWTFTRCRP
jgi:hypothetical protein